MFKQNAALTLINTIDVTFVNQHPVYFIIFRRTQPSPKKKKKTIGVTVSGALIHGLAHKHVTVKRRGDDDEHKGFRNTLPLPLRSFDRKKKIRSQVVTIKLL